MTDPVEFNKRRLVDILKAEIKAQGMTQKQVADLLEVSQPRVSTLVNYKYSLFSLETLINYLARLGKRVEVTIK